MKKLLLSTTCILAFTILFAGIMRDDVNEAAYTSLAAQKQFDCVGRVFNDDKFAGSCVLIGKHFVLSASHVFMKYTFRPDTIMVGGQKIFANRPIDAKPVNISSCRFEFGGKSYRGKSIKVYPDYNWKKQNTDIVLIELDSDVTTIKPAKINSTFDELGAEVTGVGFGTSGYGGKLETIVSVIKKIAGQNTVDSLGGDRLNGKPTTLICDFDSPTHPELNRIGSAVPRPLEYICAGGDSGGGMFRRRYGRWELVGICHGSESGMGTIMKNGYYGLLMEFTRVSVFSSWIKLNNI